MYKKNLDLFFWKNQYSKKKFSLFHFFYLRSIKNCLKTRYMIEFYIFTPLYPNPVLLYIPSCSLSHSSLSLTLYLTLSLSLSLPLGQIEHFWEFYIFSILLIVFDYKEGKERPKSYVGGGTLGGSTFLCKILA